MKNIVMFPAYEYNWENVHLLKEIGLIPYYFHREMGYNSIILSGNYGPYPFLEEYLTGVRMDILESNTLEERISYLEDNYRDIDLIIVSGPYYENFEVIKQYKQLKSDGKVWLELDMNVAFSDYLLHEHPILKEYGLLCDLITVASRRLQQYLNYKWDWKVFYFSHVYYDGFFDYSKAIYSCKENTILTVGRLGDWQKATDILLEAFARVYSDIHGWKLKLIGGVEPEFADFLNSYYERYPQIKEFVSFLGKVEDKKLLISEYKKAKVFAMPSRMEGGMPNVMPEAMRSGCAMLVTKFEAYDEAIVGGKAGLASDIDDIEAYANNMIKLCNSPNIEEYCNNSYDYAIENFDGRRNIRIANELLFGGEI